MLINRPSDKGHFVSLGNLHAFRPGGIINSITLSIQQAAMLRINPKSDIVFERIVVPVDRTDDALAFIAVILGM